MSKEEEQKKDEEKGEKSEWTNRGMNEWMIGTLAWFKELLIAHKLGTENVYITNLSDMQTVTSFTRTIKTGSC